MRAFSKRGAVAALMFAGLASVTACGTNFKDPCVPEPPSFAIFAKRADYRIAGTGDACYIAESAQSWLSCDRLREECDALRPKLDKELYHDPDKPLCLKRFHRERPEPDSECNYFWMKAWSAEWNAIAIECAFFKDMKFAAGVQLVEQPGPEECILAAEVRLIESMVPQNYHNRERYLAEHCVDHYTQISVP
jgi:hypothetical protein